MHDTIEAGAAVGRPQGTLSNFAWWPVVITALVISAVSVAAIAFRVTRSYARDPWESIIVAEAYRASVGKDVFAWGEFDHSTHMYGPLVNYLLGAIYKFTGVGFAPARILSLVSSIGIVALLTFVFFRRLPRVFMFAGVAMLLALNIRSKAYFAQCRPDMSALLAAFIALVLLYRAIEVRRWRWLVGGMLMMCIAYLFKQTMAMFAAVPLVSMFLPQNESDSECPWIKWVASATPLATLALLIVIIAMISPAVHFYTVEVPSRLPIYPERLFGNAIKFLMITSLLPVALILMITVPGAATREDRKLRWLLSACIVAAPCGVLTYSKWGGEVNSFLPALFPITVFSILMISRTWKAISTNAAFSPLHLHAFIWLLCVVMIAGAFGGPSDEPRMAFGGAFGDRIYGGLGDNRYPQAVDYVRTLKGRVVCPDDPTIPIVALGQVGRASWAEHDVLFSMQLPSYLESEIRGADWVITIDSAWPIYELPQRLPHWRYVSAGWNGAEMGPYTLWRKRRAGE
jgi:hypothetical protein